MRNVFGAYTLAVYTILTFSSPMDKFKAVLKYCMFTSGALCYAELGTSFTKSGGHYTYLLETLGPLPAFLRLWTEFIFIRCVCALTVFHCVQRIVKVHSKCHFRPAVASYVSLAFGRYVVEPFFLPCVAPTALVKIVSMLGVSEWRSGVDYLLFS